MANLSRIAEFVLCTEDFLKAISDEIIVEKDEKLFLCLKEDVLVPLEAEDFSKRNYILDDGEVIQTTLIHFVPTNDYSYCDVYFFLQANNIQVNSSFYKMNENDNIVSIYVEYGELVIHHIQSVIRNDDVFYSLSFMNDSHEYAYRTAQVNNLVISVPDSKVFGNKMNTAVMTMLITKYNYIDLFSEIKSFFLHRLGKLPKGGFGIVTKTITLK